MQFIVRVGSKLWVKEWSASGDVLMTRGVEEARRMNDYQIASSCAADVGGVVHRRTVKISYSPCDEKGKEEECV